MSRDGKGNIKCAPIFSRILTLFAEANHLKYAVPGGLIGVGTNVDPTLCRADRLVGQVLGEVGKLPNIFHEIEINFFLLRQLLGVKDSGKQSKVQRLGKGEVLMVNIGSTSSGGRVLAVKHDLAKIVLTSPVCTEVNEKIALSRRIEKHWRYVVALALHPSILRSLVQNPNPNLLVRSSTHQSHWMGNHFARQRYLDRGARVRLVRIAYISEILLALSLTHHTNHRRTTLQRYVTIVATAHHRNTRFFACDRCRYIQTRFLRFIVMVVDESREEEEGDAYEILACTQACQNHRHTGSRRRKRVRYQDGSNNNNNNNNNTNTNTVRANQDSTRQAAARWWRA